MPGPWDKYAATTASPAATPSGPWEKYGAPPPSADTASTPAPEFPGVAQYSNNPTFQRMKQHGFDDLHAAAAAAYEQLPFLQKLKQDLVPGARDKWLANTFNNGNYIPSANPYERVLRPTVGEMTGGAMDIAHGDIAGGAHRVISGAGTAALPLLPGAAAKAPGAVLKAMAGGYIGGKVGETAANALGATPEQSALSGDVGNIVGGGLAAATTPGNVVTLARKGATAAAKSVGQNISPETIKNVDFLASPREYLLRQLREAASSLPDNASEATHPKTTQVMQDAVKFINEIEQRQEPTAPNSPKSMEGYYGKTPTKSNLKGNQRQLFGPTTSTAPNPTAPQQSTTFIPKSEPTAEDLKFQDANLAQILQATLGQLRRAK